jgi:hypothetical protein
MAMEARCISTYLQSQLHADTSLRPLEKCRFMNPSCNFTYGSESERWLSSNTLPPYSQLDPQVPKPAFLRTIEAKLDELNPELRELSLQIHGLSYVFKCYFLNTILGAVAHPELMWKEK